MVMAAFLVTNLYTLTVAAGTDTGLRRGSGCDWGHFCWLRPDHL